MSELERYPTVTDIYAATLPFGENEILCKWPYEHNHYWCDVCLFCTPPSWVAKSIRRTQERWTWFSSARELDDERGEPLGTLGYLPWEIHQEILKTLFHRSPYDHCTELITESMIPGTIYPSSFAEHTYYSCGMRLASPSTRVELEYYYLTESDFKCKSPEGLEAFLDRLSVYQQSLLRSFTFNLFARLNIADPRNWVAAFARLPSNLISIRFNVNGWNVSGFETDGHWFILGRGRSTADRAVALLDILGKRARRCAARAKIGLSGCCNDAEYIVEWGDEVCSMISSHGARIG